MRERMVGKVIRILKKAREETIRRVVAILKSEERNLSDGYAYYCDRSEVENREALDSIEDKTLRRIAERIVDDLPLSLKWLLRRKGYEKNNDE